MPEPASASSGPKSGRRGERKTPRTEDRGGTGSKGEKLGTENFDENKDIVHAKEDLGPSKKRFESDFDNEMVADQDDAVPRMAPSEASSDDLRSKGRWKRKLAKPAAVDLGESTITATEASLFETGAVPQRITYREKYGLAKPAAVDLEDTTITETEASSFEAGAMPRWRTYREKYEINSMQDQKRRQNENDRDRRGKSRQNGTEMISEDALITTGHASTNGNNLTLPIFDGRNQGVGRPPSPVAENQPGAIRCGGERAEEDIESAATPESREDETVMNPIDAYAANSQPQEQQAMTQSMRDNVLRRYLGVNAPVVEGVVISDNSEDEPLSKANFWGRRHCRSIMAALLIVIVVAIVVALVVTKTGGSSEEGREPAPSPPTWSSPPTGSLVPTTLPTTSSMPTGTPTQQRLSSISQIVYNVSRIEHFKNDSSPQSRAFEWLVYGDELELSGEDYHHVVQRYALATLYFAMGGVTWTKQNAFLMGIHECGWWLTRNDENADDDCRRQAGYGDDEDTKETERCVTGSGVFCTSGDVANYILLYENNLTGSIPEEIGLLSNMKYIDLSANSLSGPIPTTIGNMSNLESISLYVNGLSGTLPSQIGNLANVLIDFEVHYNELVGTIPESLYQLHALQLLNLGDNFLEGTLSTRIGELSHLVGFFAFDNLLTGSVPSEIGRLEYLTYTRNHGNGFTGTIPTQIGNLAKVSGFWLYGCRLNGTIPDEIGGMKDLETFRLQEQDLSGPLPTSLYDLTQLRQLYIFTNHLNGTISSKVGQLTNAERLVYRKNQFTGTIPTELATLSKLEYLWLHYNDFTGPVPENLCVLRNESLRFINADCLPSNDTGPIPNPCKCCTTCCDNVRYICFMEK